MTLHKPFSRDTGAASVSVGRLAPETAVEAAWPRTRHLSPPSDAEDLREYLLHPITASNDEPPASPAVAARRVPDEYFAIDESAITERGKAAPSPDGDEHTDFDTARRRAYEAEVILLFRQRLSLVCVLTLVALPLFNLFHRHFTPHEEGTLLFAYISLSAIGLATFFLANRLRTLRALRFLTFFAYTIYCSIAAEALSLTGDKNPGFLLGSYDHIVLSLLLLPLSLWECFAIGVIALGTMAWTGWSVLMPQFSAHYYSHLFITSLTTLWVMCIAHFQNVTRRRAFDATFDLTISAAQLRAQTFRDALTGGYNRRYLEQALETEIARAARYERPLSVVMFDLDNFKSINDSCGHTTGDEVLRVVWCAAMKVVRGIDTAARYGGDEFALILPDADEEAARSIAVRLQNAVSLELQEHFDEDTLPGRTTLSIGIVTTHVQRTTTPQELLARADQFLYAAKRNGKNTIAS